MKNNLGTLYSEVCVLFILNTIYKSDYKRTKQCYSKLIKHINDKKTSIKVDVEIELVTGDHSLDSSIYPCCCTIDFVALG